MIKKSVTALILAQLIIVPFQAQAKELVSSFDLLQADAFKSYNDGNEYMSGKEPGVVMMKVNLWGAVKKPGIHHIPVKTDLISLLSYGGGPNDNADTEDLMIKRNLGNNRQKIIDVNLDQVIRGDQTYNLTLQPEDIIVVPVKEPVINQNTFQVTTLIATIATTALTVVLLSRQNKD